jgi:hypothetical protein
MLRDAFNVEIERGVKYLSQVVLTKHDLNMFSEPYNIYIAKQVP